MQSVKHNFKVYSMSIAPNEVNVQYNRAHLSNLTLCWIYKFAQLFCSYQIIPTLY